MGQPGTATSTFGTRLKHQRDELELTRKMLAIRSGVSLNTLERIENGRGGIRGVPSDAVLIKLARVFGLEVSELRAWA